MRRFVAFCLNRPITTLTIHITLLVLGGLAITRLPLNSMPENQRPRISVTIPYQNADPHQVELEVTRPVEEALATLSGIQEISSESNAGRSRVTLRFTWGTDLDLVKMDIRERIARIKNELPLEVIDRIRIGGGGWRDNDAMMTGRISSRGVDLSKNYELLVNRLQRPLERIEGVAQVVLEGVTPLEIQVTFRQDDLDRHGLRLGDIVRRLQDNNIDLTVGDADTRTRLLEEDHPPISAEEGTRRHDEVRRKPEDTLEVRGAQQQRQAGASRSERWIARCKIERYYIDAAIHVQGTD